MPDDPYTEAIEQDYLERIRRLQTQKAPTLAELANDPQKYDEAIEADFRARIARMSEPSDSGITDDFNERIARLSQPPISGSSFLEKAIDVINTPQQMLFGLLTQEAGETAWDAMVRGMRENTRMLDVLQREFDADPNRFATKALAFAGDVLLDVTNLVGGLVFKGVAKGVKLTGALGVSAAKFAAPNLSQKLYESAVLPIAHKFSKTALRTEAEKDLIKLIDFEIGHAQTKAQRILLEEAEARKIASAVAKKLGMPEERLLAEVARRVEIKTGAQLAFPFATLRESKKILSHEAPQLDFFSKAELSKEFAKVEGTLKSTGADFNVMVKLPGAEAREIAQQVTQLKQRLENVLLRETQFGLKTRRLEDSTVDYLTHLTTPEAKKALLQLPEFRSFGRVFNPRHAFQLARKLDETHPAIARAVEEGGAADIKTLNKLWMEGELFPKLGPQKAPLFVEDPFLAAAVRRVRGEKAIADAQVLIKASLDKRFALPLAEAPAHWRPMRLPTDARFDRLRSYVDHFRYEPEVVNLLEESIETTLLPEGLDTFLKTFDTVQNLWKQITLAPFPGYHLRNLMGNFWNNRLAGLKSPLYYEQAFLLQRASRQLAAGKKVAEPTFELGGKAYTASKLSRLAEDFGVTSGTFIESEILRKGMRGLSPQVFFTAEDIPGLGKVVKKGMEAGRAIENNSRLAHFMYRLDKGDTPMEAALSVKKYLFDYQRGLTPFEQKVMRRIFPFYAWTRFNVPLQIQSVVENPQPYIRLSQIVQTVRTRGIGAILPGVEVSPQFEEAAASYRGDDQRLLAEWIKESVGVPFRIGPEGEPEYFLLAGWLPAGDVNVLSKKGFYDRLRNLLSPFIRTPIEQLTNYDLFRLEQIEKFPGETGRFMGVETRKRNAQILRNIRLLSEADRFIKFVTDKDDPSEAEQSAFSAIARLIFGIKAYEAKPHVEAAKLRREQIELKRLLRPAVRAELEGSIETLRGLITGEESEEEEE